MGTQSFLISLNEASAWEIICYILALISGILTTISAAGYINYPEFDPTRIKIKTWATNLIIVSVVSVLFYTNGNILATVVIITTIIVYIWIAINTKNKLGACGLLAFAKPAAIVISNTIAGTFIGLLTGLWIGFFVSIYIIDDNYMPILVSSGTFLLTAFFTLMIKSAITAAGK